MAEAVSGESGYQGIPNVVYTSLLWLNAHALEVEGLWRVSGSSTEVDEWMTKFDEWGNAELPATIDAHTVTSLLMRWLKLSCRDQTR